MVGLSFVKNLNVCLTGAWKGEPMKSNKSALARVRRIKVKYSCGRKYGIRYRKRWCDELGDAARPRPKKEVERPYRLCKENENSVPANVRKLTSKDQIRVLIMAYKRMQDIHLAECVRYYYR